MGLFQNLTKVKVRKDWVFANKYPGYYWMRLDKVGVGKLYTDGSKRDTRNRLREEFITIHMTVISVLDCTEPPPRAMVGEELVNYIKVTGNEYAEKNFAQFLMGVFGLRDASELDSPEIRALLGDKDWEDWLGNEDPKYGPVQPLTGSVIEMRNRFTLPSEKQKAENPAATGFVNLWYQRPVPAAEVQAALPPDQLKRYFPGGFNPVTG